MTDPEITIAVCTKDREQALATTLDSLAQQRWSGTWDVLVVDNASSDDTAGVASRAGASFPVPLTVEHEPTLGLAHGRNLALRAARGRAIVYIDDDVNLDPGWLEAVGEGFRGADVVALGGPIRPLMPPETPEWFLAILGDEVGGPTSRYDFGDEDIDIMPEGDVPPPFGANMGFLRERGLAIGGFRPDLGWGKKMIPSEEFEFFRRYIEGGGRVVYRAAASVVHRIEARRTTLDYYLKWHVGYGRSITLLGPQRGAANLFSVVLRRSILFTRLRFQGRGAPKRPGSVALRAKAEQTRGEVLELVGW